MVGYYNPSVILTYVGLIFSVIGIFQSFGGNIKAALICLMISGICDMFDGSIARKVKRDKYAKSFGVQIDSLCDLVCFGVLPCCIGYASGMKSPLYVPVFCLFVLAALIRLAYFNVTEEDRQKETAERRKNYQGLPVTSISLIMPLFFLLAFTPVREYLQFVFLGVLLLTAAAFVTRSIKIKKPNSQGLIVMVVIGLVELTILLLLKFRVFC